MASSHGKLTRQEFLNRKMWEQAQADAIEAEKRARLKVPDAVASTYQEQYDGQGFQVYDLHQLPLPDVSDQKKYETPITVWQHHRNYLYTSAAKEGAVQPFGRHTDFSTPLESYLKGSGK